MTLCIGNDIERFFYGGLVERNADFCYNFRRIIL